MGHAKVGDYMPGSGVLGYDKDKDLWKDSYEKDAAGTGNRTFTGTRMYEFDNAMSLCESAAHAQIIGTQSLNATWAFPEPTSAATTTSWHRNDYEIPVEETIRDTWANDTKNQFDWGNKGMNHKTNGNYDD